MMDESMGIWTSPSSHNELGLIFGLTLKFCSSLKFLMFGNAMVGWDSNLWGGR